MFLRGSSANPDSRLEKEVQSLTKNGYSVTILAWNREGLAPSFEQKQGYIIKRMNFRAPHQCKEKIFLYLPIWWTWLFIQIMRSNCECIHAADFDTYFPALFAAKLKRIPIIYDIYDFYPDLMPLPSIIHKIATKIDITLMRHADRTIVVDSCRLKQIEYRKGDRVEIIYNTPPEEMVDNIVVSEIEKEFTIFYGGGIYPDRDIMSMLEIVASLGSIKIIIAGFGNDELIDPIKEFCEKQTCATFLGRIPYSEILLNSKKSDVLFALYNPNVPNNKVASPNKLFEAMMCGKPIIVNEGVATADKVREENCGLVIPYGDYEALKEAVLLLKNNPELRKELGENGRRAYDTKYNWKIMEKRLLDLYASLEEKQ